MSGADVLVLAAARAAALLLADALTIMGVAVVRHQTDQAHPRPLRHPTIEADMAEEEEGTGMGIVTIATSVTLTLTRRMSGRMRNRQLTS